MNHSETGEIRLTSGTAREASDTGHLTLKSGYPSFWRNATASGFSWFGETVMTDQSSGMAPSTRAARFRLTNYCGGTLSIDSATHSRADGSLCLDETLTLGTQAALTVIVSSGEGEKQILLNINVQLRQGSEPFQAINLNDDAGNAVGPVIELGETPVDFDWCHS